MKTPCLVVLSVLLFSTAGGADEITEMPPGTKVSNTVTMGNVQVPLPKGEWELKIVFTKTDNNAGKFGRVVLYQDQKQSGFSEVDVITNLDGCTPGRRPRNLCDHENSHNNESDKNYNRRDGSCWDVTHLVFDPYKKRKKGFYKDFWNRRGELMKARGQDVTTYVANAYYRSSRCKVVYSRYLTRPDEFGFHPATTRWRDSPWHPRIVRHSQRKKDFVSAVKAAGERLHEAIDKGFDRDLDGWTSDIAIAFE